MALLAFPDSLARWVGRFLAALVIGFAIQFVPPVQKTLTNLIVLSIASSSEWIISSFGSLIVRDGNIISHGTGGAAVHVTEACDGIGLFVLFAAAVFACRLRYLHLAKALGIGLLAIQSFNLLRVILLFFLRPGSNLLFDLVHVYLMPLLSAVILLAVFLTVMPSDRYARSARGSPRE